MQLIGSKLFLLCDFGNNLQFKNSENVNFIVLFDDEKNKKKKSSRELIGEEEEELETIQHR